MNIRLVSTLTPEDESLMAPALLKALSGILDMLPIAYAIRVNTSDSSAVYECAQLVGHKVLSEADTFGLEPPSVAPSFESAEFDS